MREKEVICSKKRVFALVLILAIIFIVLTAPTKEAQLGPSPPGIGLQPAEAVEQTHNVMSLIFLLLFVGCIVLVLAVLAVNYYFS